MVAFYLLLTTSCYYFLLTMHLEVVFHGGVLARGDVLSLGENVPALRHLVRVRVRVPALRHLLRVGVRVPALRHLVRVRVRVRLRVGVRVRDEMLPLTDLLTQLNSRITDLLTN